MVKNIEQIQRDLDMFLDWEEKYDYIIELGKELPSYEEIRVEENLVSGCMASVWLIKSRNNDGTFSIKIDSDAIIVRGLLYIMVSIFDGKTKVQIEKVNAEEILNKLALDSHLSSQRLNGLDSVIKKIQNFEFENKMAMEAENDAKN